jgi:hypothetical protein
LYCSSFKRKREKEKVGRRGKPHNVEMGRATKEAEVWGDSPFVYRLSSHGIRSGEDTPDQSDRLVGKLMVKGINTRRGRRCP